MGFWGFGVLGWGVRPIPMFVLKLTKATKKDSMLKPGFVPKCKEGGQIFANILRYTEGLLYFD